MERMLTYDKGQVGNFLFILLFQKRMSRKEAQEQGRGKKLENLLKKRVECPVCLVVARKGPIYACPNGHVVCQKCKLELELCPICRTKMGNNKSLFAVDIIENILHKCKFAQCEDLFPLGDDLAEHERNCKHRIVSCPCSDCDEMLALSDLSKHLGKKTCCFDAEPIDVDETTATKCVVLRALKNSKMMMDVGIYGGIPTEILS